MSLTNRNKLALVSLDGLSLADLHHLTDLLPRSGPYLAGGTASRLDAGLLTSTAAIWGELLTGTAWYDNGCAGHARPWKTLNRTKVVTEGDIAVPAGLLNGYPRQLVINVPLLMPKESHRLWLSDGSLPLPVTVSPRSLMAEEPFSSYSPRPYSALAEGIHHPKGALAALIQTEKKRLECAHELLRMGNLDIGLIRLSLFDQLAHLLGANYLADEELVYTPELRPFLSFLDEWLCEVFSAVAHVALLSAFSHVPCESRLSLNELLNRGGFLTFSRLDAPARRRVAALAALADDDGDEEGQAGRASVHAQVSCHQAVLDCSRTLAASSVLGFVHVNVKDRFEDGIVERAEVAATRDVLRDFLDDTLKRSFGNAYSIWSANEIKNPHSESQDHWLPDLLVHIPSAELHNSSDKFFGPSDKPRSVHSPQGFFWSQAKNLKSALKTTEVCRLLQEE